MVAMAPIDAAMAVERERLWIQKARPARESLTDFTRRMYPRYQVEPHHRAIIEALEAVERGEIDRLIITVPPRHGKSLIASEHFPVWFLGRNPDKRIIACSHTASLAYTFSRRARNKITDPAWPFPVTVADDKGAVQAWDIADQQGGYIAAGVNGPVVGAGAHVLLIDDPVKSAADAESASQRDAVWEWYTGTAYHRLEPPGAVVLIMTRWHDDDLAGRLLKEQANGGDQWTIVDLPAVALDDDALGRQPGEALWPSKYDVAALDRIKRTMGSRLFGALYQGRPTPAEGGILKRHWFGTYTARPTDIIGIVQFWDTAYKTGDANDYSVCATIGYTRTGRYLLDVYRERLEYPDLKRMAPRMAAQWRPDAVLIEDKASGQSLLQDMRRETDLPVIPVPVVKDKIARVNEMAPTIEAGRLLLPEAATWLDETIHELTAFPLAAHDDIVDAVIGGLAWIEARTTQQTSWGGSWLPDDDDRDPRSGWA